MERIKFITDTTGDISDEDAKRLDIHLVPMGILLGEKFCRDRVDFDAPEFWDILKNTKEEAKTVGINPQDWYDVLEPYVKAGEYDRLIVSGVARSMSGTLNYAVQAKEMLLEDYPEEMKKISIDVYDSNMSTIGLGVGYVKAAEMYQKGAEYPEIHAFLQDWFENVEVFFVAFSLDLPKRSGRINSSSALVGSLLNIRPIMMVKEGKFTLNCKVRGDNKVPTKLLEIAKTRMREGSDYFCMNGTHPTVVGMVEKAFEAEYGKKMFSTSQAGPAMCLNGGWDMFCVGFLGKEPIPLNNPLKKGD